MVVVGKPPGCFRNVDGVRWESARTGRGCRRRSEVTASSADLPATRADDEGWTGKCTLLRGEAAPFLGGRRCADCCKPCRKIEVEDKTLVVRWNMDRTPWDASHKSVRRTTGRVEGWRNGGITLTGEPWSILPLCFRPGTKNPWFGNRRQHRSLQITTATKKKDTSLPGTERDMAQTQDGRSDPLRYR